MHTIVSGPNPKQWQMGHTSDLIMIIKSSTNILPIIIKGMGKVSVNINNQLHPCISLLGIYHHMYWLKWTALYLNLFGHLGWSVGVIAIWDNWPDREMLDFESCHFRFTGATHTTHLCRALVCQSHQWYAWLMLTGGSLKMLHFFWGTVLHVHISLTY